MVFDRSSTGLEAGRELMRLRQGRDSVSDYSIEFQMLATDSGWEGRALVDSFLHGLSEEVKDELLTRSTPVWRIDDEATPLATAEKPLRLPSVLSVV